jgi:NitT/TauT family transport system permease protein
VSAKRNLALAPWVFTLGFFLLWELVCRALRVSPVILPRRAPSLRPSGSTATSSPSTPCHTLWMTLAVSGSRSASGSCSAWRSAPRGS